MKKYLLLFVSILSIFFITDSVNALSFNLNGKETEVNGDNYIYYFYKLRPELFDEYNYFLSFMYSDGSYLFAFSNNVPTSSNLHFHFMSNYIRFAYSTYYCFYTKDFELTECVTKSSVNISTTGYSNLFNNIDLYYTINASNKGSYPANISKDDLLGSSKMIYTITYYLNNEVYKTVEVEEGTSHELLSYDYNDNTHIFSGWQYDENIDLNNITSNIEIKATLTEKDVIPVYIEFPIDKTEFYVLLVEVGVLIMIIFLKWCFPFKGGTDL